jgi:hypothetical protein
MDETPTPPPDPTPDEASAPAPGETPVPPDPAQAGVTPKSGWMSPRGPAPCATCGQPMTTTAAPATATAPAGFSPAQAGFVYAIGRLSPQFQSLDVEKEFAQLAAQIEEREVSEHHRLKTILEQDDTLYLAHHICWVFTSQGVDSFAVVPRDTHDARQLVDAFVPASEENVVNVVVGRPATAPPPWDWSSAGLRLVSADQILTFTLDEFINALDSGNGDGDGGANTDHQAAMRELFFRLTRRADNQGLADTHRACNYVALRYPALYRATLQALDDGKALVGVEARPTPSGDRRLVSVRLIFRDRRTQIVERYGCSVDVTGEFCFLATPLSTTYD